MKKTLLTAILAVVLAGLAAGPASAGGWWESGEAPWDYLSVGPGGVTDPKAAYYNRGGWNEAEADGYGVAGSLGPTVDRSPHRGFAATSNNCKTCHAVHEADGDSWRLLRGRALAAETVQGGFWSNGFQYDEIDNGYQAGSDYGGEGAYNNFNPDRPGSDRVGECDVCHLGAGSLSYKRQYKLRAASVRAEHSLGYEGDIPGSDNGAGARTQVPGYGEIKGLRCYTCHAVHGAGSVGGDWSAKILSNDPNNDDKGLDGLPGGANEAAERQAAVSAFGSTPANMSLSMFCGDCHNANWRNPGDAGGTAVNMTTHPSWHDSTDLHMEIYGDPDVKVAFKSIAGQGCRACHRASNQFSADNNGPSIWPHQSVGFKFLVDSFTNQPGLIDGNGNPIDNQTGLDSVCLWCHNSAGNGTSDGDQGVGKTY